MKIKKIITLLLIFITVGCGQQQSSNSSIIESSSSSNYTMQDNDENLSLFFIEGFSTQNTEKMIELYWKNVDGLIYHYHENCPCEGNNDQDNNDDYGGFWIDFENKIFYQYAPDGKYKIVKIIYNWEMDISYIEDYNCSYDYTTNKMSGNCYLDNGAELEFTAIKSYFFDFLSLNYLNSK